MFIAEGIKIGSYTRVLVNIPACTISIVLLLDPNSFDAEQVYMP